MRVECCDRQSHQDRREYIAAQVMGYACMSADFEASDDELAARAVRLADALIATLDATAYH